MLQVLKIYKDLKESIPEMIEVSGYRNDFIAKRMGITSSTFAVKKQRNNWTDNELEKLIEALTSANKQVTEFLEMKHIDSYSSNDTMTSEEFKMEMGWK